MPKVEVGKVKEIWKSIVIAVVVATILGAPSLFASFIRKDEHVKASKEDVETLKTELKETQKTTNELKTTVQLLQKDITYIRQAIEGKK